MGESTSNGLTEVKIDVAVLQQQLATIQQQLADGREFMGKIDGKFDEVLTKMSEAATERAVLAERAKIHGRIWSGIRHLGTLAVMFALAKIFHVPMSLG